MLLADYTGQFRKDYKLAMKRGFDILLIDNIIRNLINEKPLESKYKDYVLSGNYAGYRECHIKPDWLLIYQIGNGIIVFERTGSHSDLF
jgi:mRNA interferase YafQ